MSAPQGYVKVGVVGYSDRGNYDATATYNKWNVVHYNNSLYYCKVDNTTGILPTTTANWGNMVKCYEPDGETIFVNQDGKLEGAPNALPDNHTILKDSNDVISVNEVYAQDETSLMSAMASLPTGAVGYTPEPNTLDMNQLYADMGVNETGDTALYAHASGSYFLWKGDLVKATSAIAVGGTIASTGQDINVVHTNISEALNEPQLVASTTGSKTYSDKLTELYAVFQPMSRYKRMNSQLILSNNTKINCQSAGDGEFVWFSLTSSGDVVCNKIELSTKRYITVSIDTSANITYTDKSNDTSSSSIELYAPL